MYSSSAGQCESHLLFTCEMGNSFWSTDNHMEDQNNILYRILQNELNVMKIKYDGLGERY